MGYHTGPGEWVREARCSQLLRAKRINREDFNRWFFPTRESTKIEITTGKDICALCPVKVQCLTWAYETRSAHGTLGGLTANERLTVLRRTEDEAYAENEGTDLSDQKVVLVLGQALLDPVDSDASDAA